MKTSKKDYIKRNKRTLKVNNKYKNTKTKTKMTK